MTTKKNAIVCGLVTLSALAGYEIGLADLASFAHDEFTIIQKHLDKSCTYQLHENILFVICPKSKQIVS